MILKHKDEWPILVDIARRYYLDTEQTIILLALREAADGKDGFEFRYVGAIDKSLEAQAILAAKHIKDKDWLYQAYLKRLGPGHYQEDFIEYLASDEAYKLKRYVDLITEEFSYKERNDAADPGIIEVLEEDIE